MGAFLAGVPLMGDVPQRWPVKTGVSPTFMEFDVPRSLMAGLMQNAGVGGGVTLEFTGPGGGKIEKLFILTDVAPDNPAKGRVRVTNRNYLWTKKWVLGRYNMPRRVGSQIRGDWNAALVPEVPDPRFEYAVYSLNDGEAWNALEVLIDILTKSYREGGLEEAGVKIDAEVETLRKVSVNALSVDAMGANALGQVLGLLPGVDVCRDPDGLVRLMSRLSGREGEVVQSSGPELLDAGSPIQISGDFTRPRMVRVGFTIESEIRFDFLGDGFAPTIDEENPIRHARNVLPIPDHSGVPVGQKLKAQGTWEVIRDYLEAVGPAPRIGVITPKLLNRAMLPELKLVGAIGVHGLFDPDGENLDWGLRISTLMQHWRTTFQIERHWMDRFLAIRAHLTASINTGPAGGQRARARVYADHAIRPSQKAHILASLDAEELAYAFNIPGYPGENAVIEQDTARPAPAILQIVDHDQGILHLNWTLGPFGLADHVFPGLIANSDVKVPVGTVRPDLRRSNTSQPIAFNIRAEGGQVPQLATEDRIAMIFTAVPASPNDKRQLYWIDIKPEDVKELLPAAAAAGLSSAKGPVQELRIGAGIETARIRWKDDERETIEKIFGVGGFLENPTEELADLIVNRGEGVTEGAAGLQSIARAIAATVYAKEADRTQGRKQTSLNMGVVPQGYLSEVVHSSKDGEQTTSMGLPDSVDPLNFAALLPPDVRQVIFREVFPQG